MLQSISSHLCTFLIRRNVIRARDSPVYQYGFEITLSTCFIFLSILLIAFFSQYPYSGMLYLLIISPLRITAGGYHAKTYKGCFVLSNLVFLCTLLVASLLTAVKTPGIIWWLILSVSCLYIRKNSPMHNPHHPISDKIKAQNRKRLFLFLMICFTVLTVLICILKYNFYLNLSVLSVLSVACLMIPVQRKEIFNHV